jgi:hypothetical protein
MLNTSYRISLDYLEYLIPKRITHPFMSTKNIYVTHSKILALNLTFHNHNSYIPSLVWCGRELADYVYNLV